jgi:hypothetical protein
MNNTDDSNEIPNVNKSQPKYSSYKFFEDEWKLLAFIQKVLNVRTKLPGLDSVLTSFSGCSFNPGKFCS